MMAVVRHLIKISAATYKWPSYQNRASRHINSYVLSLMSLVSLSTICVLDTSTSPLSSDRHSMDNHWHEEAEAVAAAAPAPAATSPINDLLSPVSVDSTVPTITHGVTTKEDQWQEEKAAPTIPRFLPRMAPNATSKTKKERKKKVATACAICFRNKVKCDGNFPCAR